MTLDEYISIVDKRIAAMERIKASALYAACAERFIPLYAAFAEAERWGDAVAVRRHLDLAWSLCLRDAEPEPIAAWALEDLLAKTPHADDFDSVETTFAQNVCVLVSVAIRAALGRADQEQEYKSIDAAFEILRVAECVEATGFLDLGDGREAREFESRFMAGALFAREAEFQNEDFDTLLGLNSDDVAGISALRSRAERNRYSAEELLPTQSAGK